MYTFDRIIVEQATFISTGRRPISREQSNCKNQETEKLEKKNHCTNSYYVLLNWSKSFSVYLRVIESQIWKNTNKYLVQRHFEFK